MAYNYDKVTISEVDNLTAHIHTEYIKLWTTRAQTLLHKWMQSGIETPSFFILSELQT